MKAYSSFTLAISLLSTVSLYATGGGFPCGNGNLGGPNKCDCPGEPCATGDQVAAYTGNEQRTVDDLAIWGGVGEHQLVFQRYGNSRFTNATTTFGNGHSWRHSYQWELSTTATDTNGAPKTLDLYYPNGEHNTLS
jgi:hypothetical protein